MTCIPLRYFWRGEEVSEEEFLRRSESQLVPAELVERYGSLADRKERVLDKRLVPFILIETQRFGPGVTGCDDYSYWRLSKEDLN